jgi:hypothetical protein
VDGDLPEVIWVSASRYVHHVDGKGKHTYVYDPQDELCKKIRAHMEGHTDGW